MNGIWNKVYPKETFSNETNSPKFIFILVLQCFFTAGYSYFNQPCKSYYKRLR